ncbi:MAG: ATP-binding protein [Rhodocyclaceae bacterium]|nr:ATP-binding protein [Rhodocyclaceae bacterium]
MTTTQTRQKLPIGIQSFAKLREQGCYYVDKTRLALELIEQGSHYFLSRPRRFGKSLFLDTLAELFSGNQALFSGLYCESRWDWQTRYPVIRISFGAGVLRNRAELDEKIAEILAINQEALGITCTLLQHHARFAELIRQAHAQTGQRVVVLVDEYDKPILDNLTSPDAARELRDGLRDFYSVIKDSDAHIKFAFLTGVSKFSKVSIFSGLNNLNDITLDAAYSAICGYTDSDIDRVFAPELPGLDRDEIRSWYNGYNWGGEAVYNPFDLLLLFSKRAFRPYWFETGTPTFLVDLMIQRQTFTPDLSRQHSSLELLSAFDVDHIEAAALLFQTGYTTIHAVEEYLPGQQVYTLGYPNKEVQTSLNNALLPALGLDGQRAFTQRLNLLSHLRAQDFSGLAQHFSSLYASIPHDWYRNNPIAQYEGYYASVFYSHIAALGLDISVEDATHQGRVDMSVRFNGQVWLFEFKVVELSPEGKALAQLKAKNYAEKYKSRGEPIHLIGIEFSKETRSVVGFEVETLLS